MASILDQVPYNNYTGNGVATAYPFEFELLDAGDFVASIDGVEVPSSDYTLSGLTQAGGTCTFDIAPANGTAVLLQRLIALERDTDYQYNGDLREETLDRDFNRLWQALQGQSAQLGGTLRLPYPEQAAELPSIADRADKILSFDSSGSPIATAPVAGTATALALALASTASAADGDALIGVKRPNSGASATTLHDWMNRQHVTPLDFGGVGDGVTADDTAWSSMIATGKPVVLPSGYNWRLDASHNISVMVTGEGADDNQSCITLTGSGALVVDDEQCKMSNFKITSSVAANTWITCTASSFETRNIRFVRGGGAINQVGIKYDATNNSIYFCKYKGCKSNLDRPIQVVGAAPYVFNANDIGDFGTYFQSFESAIDIAGVAAADANEFCGYFETGTNAINFSGAALRQNRFRLVLDVVTRTLNTSTTIADVNLWEILDGGFTVAGTYPQNQVLTGPLSTKVRATQGTAQAIPNATATTVVYDTEVFDTLTEFVHTTGIFTAKNAGYYRVTGGVLSASVAWAAGNRWEVRIYKNGVEYAKGDWSAADAATTRQRSSYVSCLVNMNGTTDTIELVVIHNQGGAVALDTAPTANFIEIERLQ